MLVEQLEHGHDGGGERQRYAHEESGSVDGGVWVARAATENAQQRVETRQRRAFCCGMQRVLAGVTAAQGAGPVREFCWCVGLAGAGREDAVRLAGCEGSVSLAWRAGVG